MKLQAYIVEDAPKDFELIKEVLSELPNVKVVNNYPNTHYPYKKSVDEINFHKFNLIIIDHELNEADKTGLDLFMEVKNIHSFVIFCSQYPEKARDNDIAFSNAKFVEKTSNKELLKSRFQKVMLAVEDYFAKYPNALTTMFKLDEDTEEKVVFTDILYIESDNKSTRIYFDKKDKPIIIKKVLKDFSSQNELHTLGFIRVSRTHIVNGYRISSVRNDRVFRSGKKVVLIDSNGRKIDIPIGSKYKTSPEVTSIINLYKK